VCGKKETEDMRLKRGREGEREERKRESALATPLNGSLLRDQGLVTELYHSYRAARQTA
jgi:hypothetical protein